MYPALETLNIFLAKPKHVALFPILSERHGSAKLQQFFILPSHEIYFDLIKTRI
ncbi:hypothetical protein H312_03404 [Anncaliia algerae PRA339]|uniref:Uncharacterized protein n=1 Tax=Anncaliia algerae PRA339 TaxID=1288291 RepID=A0A059EVZ8_9MICR|nr:hypothetical protein H312_03404 [Anncaliia algerae PRA339]